MEKLLQIFDADVQALDQQLAGIHVHNAAARRAIERLRTDAAAIRFHLRPAQQRSPLVVILGGTGTGKSTIVNRLLDAEVSATSYTRTFTAGAVAVAQSSQSIPTDWLGVVHRASSELPARGQQDVLTVAVHDGDLTRKIILIDTPDLDGDQPAHHAQADRAFRWADAVIFLVTPEKYQMTELRPYYRLAQRYALPSIYVMNKVEDCAAVEDFARQVGAERVYVVPRDDSAHQPPAELSLDALRTRLMELTPPPQQIARTGIVARIVDWLDRLRDQVIDPLREDRRSCDELIEALSAMETPQPGVDVNPLTRQLQRRLQEKSVLYLMGPGRMLDRLRQAPGMIARLPRTAWDLFKYGEFRSRTDATAAGDFDGRVPDFRANLVDQFRIIQSRIEDSILSTPAGKRWLDDADRSSVLVDPDDAGKIADEELTALRQWLEQHWDKTPRDTRVLKALLKVLPGAEKLTSWSESAPYILAVVVATHHTFFGPVDLLILGGFSLAVWMTEKISNEVASQARHTNSRISQRFADLAHEQIRRTCDWLNAQCPTARQMDDLERLANQLHERLK